MLHERPGSDRTVDGAALRCRAASNLISIHYRGTLLRLTADMFIVRVTVCGYKWLQRRQRRHRRQRRGRQRQRIQQRTQKTQRTAEDSRGDRRDSLSPNFGLNCCGYKGDREDRGQRRIRESLLTLVSGFSGTPILSKVSAQASCQCSPFGFNYLQLQRSSVLQRRLQSNRSNQPQCQSDSS